MANKQYLAEGQDVTFVGPDKQHHKAKITTVYSEHTARVEWATGTAIAEFSDAGGENTFHFGEASTKAEHKKT